MKAARQAVNYAAEQLGFSAVGVAPADAPQGDSLKRWLQAGCHADMAWLERHLPLRLDPGKLLDLDETLQIYGGKQRCFSDSGPVSERFFAAMAGLGWIGRHGLLVRSCGGSFCFLSCILTTLPLQPDTPMKDHCGKCRRCEEACPTRALSQRRCDARRCLSYWTIESKQTDAPQEIREALRGKMYGCDVCQEVCPWNHMPTSQRVDPHLLMPARLSGMSPDALAELSEEDWERLFANSPIHRTGAAHLRRNILAFPGS